MKGPAHSFILFPGPTAWRFIAAGQPQARQARVEIPPDATPSVIANAIADQLKFAGYGGEGLLLAIPSAWCLCAPVGTRGLPARNRWQAMTYRLEDQLPVAAEDFIADFLPHDPSCYETLGVCAQKADLSPMVAALESSGVAVAAICPAALLSMQWFHTERSDPGFADLINAAAWPSEQSGKLELFIFRKGHVRTWYLLSDGPEDLLMHLAVEFRGAGSQRGKIHLTAMNLSTLTSAALSKHPGLHLSAMEGADPLDAASSMAGLVLAGKAVPWINLRRGELAVREPFRQVRTPLAFAAAAIMLCLLCLCGGMLWRANQYDRLASRDAERQQALFRKAFPNDAMPPDVRSRLDAEERGLHGLTGDTATPALQANGLILLGELMRHLPTADALRYRVLELRLDAARFTLEGQAASHGDADLIATALRRSNAFQIEPPRTEQLGGSTVSDDATTGKGVAFTITGAGVSMTPPGSVRSPK